MDFCCIPPLANLDLMTYGDRYFLLGQLHLRHQSYRDFVDTHRDKFMILDSGIGDFDSIDLKTLIDLTKEIVPDEVISLDVLFDGNKTIENHKRFVEGMDKAGRLGPVQIMFVPQGKNLDEWLECYRYALESPYVDTIGWSKIGVPHAFLGKFDNDQNTMQGRHKCYDMLLDADLIQKPIHCLGAGNVLEFLHYEGNPLMRSTDSCFSVLAAINNFNWKSLQTDRIPTPKNYFTDCSLKQEQMSTFLDNVAVLKDMCHR